MNVLQLLQLILTLGASLESQLKLGGDVPEEVIADVQAGLQAFQRVQGTPVVFQDLEGLRLATAWPDATPKS